MKKMRENTLGVRTWLALLVFGLIGQVAWVVENMYFNVFLYNTITGDTNMIATMVAASSVVATVTTLVVGALSDKLGKRKSLIVGGYLLWGLSVMAFALVSVAGLQKLMPVAAAMQTAAILVIVLDCVMTFFGSSANDAAFNAWVTDVTSEKNRGRVETVLAIMPMVAMLLVFGLLDGLTQAGEWSKFFLIIGGLTLAGGALGKLLIREPENLTKSEGNYAASILYGLRPSVIFANPELYLSLLALAIFCASQQVYMPYLIIYIQRYLGIADYAIVLGVVLVTASVISVLMGRVIDKKGKLAVAVPAVAVTFAGVMLMFFMRSMVAVIIAGIVMMGASMVLTACMHGLIRDYTPENKAGQFQGIRILFQVLLPAVTGPYIGSAVIGSSGQTYEELGTVKQVPTPDIFLFSGIVLLLIAIPLFLLHMKTKKKTNNTVRPLFTPWGEKLDRDNPLSEYPRPQLWRGSYLNLNGRWEYAIRKDGTAPESYDGEIIVPFSPESLLSGVGRQLMPGDTLWYRRSFTLPEGFQRDKVLLHFGAVDQECRVLVNGELVGEHKGGYLPFSCDITDSLSGGENTLTVIVTDCTSASCHAYGKQSFNRGGIWYTPQSGIWQTVWMESVVDNYVENLRITPLFDEKRVRIEIRAKNALGAKVVIHKDGTIIAEQSADADGVAELSIADEQFHPWTPDDPFLYDISIEMGGDSVESYFGMRKFGTTEWGGKKVLALNNKPIFMNGVLDQGYWSDGLYTAPDDEALIYDIQTMKDLGFNMLRKHIKIEPLRWYYHCDRLGMLVWQDAVSGGDAYNPMVIQVLPFIGVKLRDTKYRTFGRTDEAGRDQFMQDLYDMVDLLYNTTSLAMWVPFNEGWGQFDSLQVTQILWELDETRLVDHASGWHDQGGGDLNSFHVYYKPVRIRHDKNRVLALTEFGGYSMPLSGHMSSEKEFGYRIYRDRESFMDAYAALFEKEIIPCMEKQALSATVYTQVSDVEDEVNGLVTYDRKVCKVDEGRVRRINERLKF